MENIRGIKINISVSEEQLRDLKMYVTELFPIKSGKVIFSFDENGSVRDITFEHKSRVKD
jgi:hypothetical protein